MAEVHIPEGYGLAKLIWTMAGKANPITSTCGYSGALTPPEDCALAIAQFAYTSGSICDPDVMAGTYSFDGVEVIQNVGGVLTGAFAEGSFGAGGGTALPPINASLLMSKRTARIGRQYQGRMYLPNTWLGEASIDAMGNLTGTGPTTFASQVDVFSNGLGVSPSLTGFLTDPATFAVILHTDPALTPTKITSFVARTQMATQRRRMRS